MTIVIKSNVVSTAHLENLNGIRGAQDFVIFNDFAKNKYFLSGLDTSFGNAMLYSRSSSASFLNSSNILETVANNIPLLSANGMTGLVFDTVHDSLFRTLAANTPLTTGVTYTSAVSGAYNLRVYGSGSVTLSGAVTAQSGYSLTATSARQELVTLSNGTITATVTGSVLHYELVPNMHVTPVISTGFNQVAAEIKSTALLGSAFTLLFKYVGLAYPAGVGGGDFIIASFELSSNETVEIATNYLKQLVVKKYTGTTLNNTYKVAASDSKVVAISKTGASITVAMGGVVVATVTCDVAATISNFRYTQSKITLTKPSQGIHQKTVAYNYAMSDEDLKKLSMSFAF